MPEAVKKRKRSEEDVTELLQSPTAPKILLELKTSSKLIGKKAGKTAHIAKGLTSIRYSAPTVLSLLQEVSEHTSKHSDCVKIDWNVLVKNTTTGISNAREYQMLWRHLAYHKPLLEKIEDGAEPLDDDSDLEFELEAVPALNPEELAEAKECAKVILSSGSPRICGSTPRPIAEATSNVDIPNDQAPHDPPDKLASSTCGGNSAVPVLSQKPPLSTGPSAEGLDGNGPTSSGLPAKKKRQLWTQEEDMELMAAVQKCGEGNWANILKGDFKHNRTASQLSQRWALIRRRLGNSNLGNGNKTSSSTRSEERLAAQKAFSLAVDMPMTGSLTAIYSGAAQMTSSSTSSAAISQASRACAAQSLNQSLDRGISSLFIKARPTLKKPTMPGKPLRGPNPLIQAAAFAAGGRIANPSTAASLFKAAQSKNAVHIRPGGSSLPISSTIANKSSATTNSLGAQSTPQPHPLRPISAPPSPASFGTTLSSQRSTQPASLPLASCSTASDVSSQQTSSESKLEAFQGPNSLENAERESSIGSATSDIDVEELLSEDVGVGARETGSGDAVTKERQMDRSISPLSKNQTVVEREDQLQNETAPDLALVGDTVGTQIHDKELKEKGSAEDGCAGSKSVGDEQLGGVQTVADEVTDPCPEHTTTTDSK